MNNTGPSRWWRYVTEVAGGDSQAKLARRTGLSPATVSRWQGADPRPHNVAVFAAAYGRPVLEAFVAAGFLTEQQARAQVVRADPTVLTDDELLAEVRARMGRGGQVVDVDVDDPEVDPDVVSLRAAGLTDEAIAEALRGRDPDTGSSAGAPEFHPRRRAQ